MSYIEIKDLSFSYTKKRQILKNIGINIEKGEWIAILGHNGSGKSTLAKTIVGLLEPGAGSITVDGIKLDQDTLQSVRRKIGIVFQNPDNQFVGVTVRDDIAFGMENLCVPKAEMLERIEYFATKVGMEKFLDKEPASLSGGQKQRVAIAGILAMQTEIMIFDEATSMLDPYARGDLMEHIKKLHNEGLTIIMITHEIEEALLADRLVIMKDGAIFADGPKEELLKKPDLFQGLALELPFSLRLANQLTGAGFEEVRGYLWESAFRK